MRKTPKPAGDGSDQHDDDDRAGPSADHQAASSDHHDNGARAQYRAPRPASIVGDGARASRIDARFSSPAQRGQSASRRPRHLVTPDGVSRHAVERNWTSSTVTRCAKPSAVCDLTVVVNTAAWTDGRRMRVRPGPSVRCERARPPSCRRGVPVGRRSSRPRLHRLRVRRRRPDARTRSGTRRGRARCTGGRSSPASRRWARRRRSSVPPGCRVRPAPTWCAPSSTWPPTRADAALRRRPAGQPHGGRGPGGDAAPAGVGASGRAVPRHEPGARRLVRARPTRARRRRPRP